jgi:hypothetical protein
MSSAVRVYTGNEAFVQWALLQGRPGLHLAYQHPCCTGRSKKPVSLLSAGLFESRELGDQADQPWIP